MCDADRSTHSALQGSWTHKSLGRGCLHYQARLPKGIKRRRIRQCRTRICHDAAAACRRRHVAVGADGVGGHCSSTTHRAPRPHRGCSLQLDAAAAPHRDSQRSLRRGAAVKSSEVWCVHACTHRIAGIRPSKCRHLMDVSRSAVKSESISSGLARTKLGTFQYQGTNLCDAAVDADFA